MDGNRPNSAEMGLKDTDLGISTEKSITPAEVTVVVNNNIATIEKPEGTYTILYGRHDKVQDPMDIPDEATALMLESGALDFVDAPSTELIQSIQELEQYTQLMDANESRQLPIYLTDAKPPDAAIIMRLLSQYSPIFTAIPGAVIGMNAVSELAGNPKKKKLLQERKDFYANFPEEHIPQVVKDSLQKNSSMSRRDFLKAGGKVALGTWLMTPLISQSIQHILYGNLEDQRDTEKVKSVHGVIHPEEKVLDAILITARNLAMAHKSQIIMEGLANDTSHMASLLGAAHYGIEEALIATPEERIASLQEMQPLLKMAFRDSTFYSYAELNPTIQEDGSVIYEKTITEVPELKEILL